MKKDKQNMKQEILSNLDYPEELEKLYRNDKNGFRYAFNALYPGIAGSTVSRFWHARLNSQNETFKGNTGELIFLLTASLIAGILVKLPDFFPIGEEFYFTRNAGFILFPALIAFFAWKNSLPVNKLILPFAAILISIVFINSLPDGPSDTLILSCLHLPIFLWFILAYAFVGSAGKKDLDGRLQFLRYNGDLIVMTTLIMIAGGILTGITVGLFSLIGFRIEEFFFENIVLFGLPAAPLLGTYLIQNNPQLVGKVSPVIARIFSPLVLIMLVIYLGAMVFAARNPYNDREFLIVFNALLIGVLALIFFSVAESSKSMRSQAENWIVFLLTVVTLIVNAIALSAIIFRILEWGLTPNRAAVLGSNALILVHLLMIAWQFFKVVTKKSETMEVGKKITGYLPLYFIYAMVVGFLFPFLFGHQ